MPDDTPPVSQPEPGVIVIAGKRYLTIARMATTVGRTTRTLQRWHDQRLGPPRVQILGLILYDESKLPAWLASHEKQPVRQPRRRRAGGSDARPAA